MELESVRLEGINITLLYERIDRGLISRDKIRTLRTEVPIITDFPDFLFIAYQEAGAQVIIDSKRISFNAPIADNRDLIFDFMADLADDIYHITNNATMEAYGYNYKGTCTTGAVTSVGDYFRDHFFVQQSLLEGLFGGSVTTVSPKFTLSGKENKFNLLLDPVYDKKNEFTFHVNVHFDKNELPSGKELYLSLVAQFNMFHKLLAVM